MTLTQIITTKQREARKTFLETFKCIDRNCDGSGSIPHQVGEDEWEAQQCEYCFVVRFPAADLMDALILSTAHSVLDAVKELVPEEKDPNEPAPGLDVGWRAEGFNKLRTELLSRLERFSSNEE